jgi:hypothetical protein
MFFGPSELLDSESPYAPLLADAHQTGIYVGFLARSVIDPSAPRTDSTQAIFRCRYTAKHILRAMLPHVSVSITPFLGLDIASTLGIQTQGEKVVPLWPSAIECDLLLDDVTTLWPT